MTVTAAQLGLAGSAKAQSRKAASFDSLKQIDAGAVNVGYVETGAAGRPVVILLHGWPYDIHSFVEVAPLLAAAGYRVLIPYLRGYGTTRFLSNETFRNGQPSAIAVDIVALMDALRIEKATLAGFDWGARTANIIAALWPDRCKAMVSVSGYLIGSQELGKMPLPPKAELEWWYQYYFATERGRAGYDKYRHDFAKLIWQLASPKWNFDDATFDRSAQAFDNPDHVAITVHNYRWRLARRCQWCAASGSRRLREEILGQVFAPADHGRYRAQPAAGSATGICTGSRRRRPSLIGIAAFRSIMVDRIRRLEDAGDRGGRRLDTQDPIVFIVDDDQRIREALSTLLSTYDLRAVTFGSAAEYLAYSKPDAPACLILDVQLPDINGPDLQSRAGQEDQPQIVFITGHGDIPTSVRAIKAGAVDFLTKPFRPEALMRAVLSAIVKDRDARSKRAELAKLRERLSSLTPREREVLPLVVSGLLNKQAAAELGISENTIQIHRAKIMEKMGAGSLAELVRMAAALEIPITRSRHPHR